MVPKGLLACLDSEVIRAPMGRQVSLASQGIKGFLGQVDPLENQVLKVMLVTLVCLVILD